MFAPKQPVAAKPPVPKKNVLIDSDDDDEDFKPAKKPVAKVSNVPAKAPAKKVMLIESDESEDFVPTPKAPVKAPV